jgi:hypothetical protein
MHSWSKFVSHSRYFFWCQGLWYSDHFLIYTHFRSRYRPSLIYHHPPFRGFTPKNRQEHSKPPHHHCGICTVCVRCTHLPAFAPCSRSLISTTSAGPTPLFYPSHQSASALEVCINLSIIDQSGLLFNLNRICNTQASS